MSADEQEIIRRCGRSSRTPDRRAFLSAMGLFVIGAAAAKAQTMQHHHERAPAEACSGTLLGCATTATPCFGSDGLLWLAFASGDQVFVTSSSDQGRTFGVAVAVAPEPLQLDWGPDARPQIVADTEGHVFVTYAIFRDKAFNGQVFYAYSADKGRSFSVPRAITADPESQRFQVLALDPAGRLFAAWLDKRRRPAARAKGERYPGAALAYTWLPKGAGDIPEATIAQDNTCECCRIGVAFAGPGRPVLLFRNIFDGGVRDHAVSTFADPSTPRQARRVSEDDWKIDACPHHGPSLAVSPGGAYNAAWFTNGRARQGVFCARSLDGGESFSPPKLVGTLERQASRPSIFAARNAVHIAWKEFNGESAAVLGMTSHDEGRTWSSAREIARTAGDSDHPLLVTNGAQTFVSWLTRTEGYRLLPVGDAS
jgi:hypothetical protein